MADVKISYSSSGTISCTLASLANSSSAGRGSASIDNTGNLFDDAMLFIAVKTSGTTLGGDKACYVYIYGSEDGTNYQGSSLEAPGSDSAVQITSPTNLKGPITISCPGTSATYRSVSSISQFFGGRMPRKWGFVVRNATGQELDPNESEHTKTYTGVIYTVV